MEAMKEINLTEMLAAIVRKIWLVVIFAVVVGVIALVYTKNFVTPMYRSSVTIYVNNKNAANIVEGVTASDLQTSQKLVNTYIKILSSNTVLEKVADTVEQKSNIQITAGEIRRKMAASAMGETEVFQVFINDANPETAAIIANAIADVAPDEIAYFVEGSSTKIVDYAKVASAPYSPNTMKNTMFGVLSGACLAVVIIVLQTLLDVRIKGEEDLAAISGVPVLGTIPDLAMDSEDQYGYNSNYRSGYQYGYRRSYKAQPYRSKHEEAEE